MNKLAKGGGIALSAVTFMIWTGATTASAEAETPDAQDTVQAIDAVAGALRSHAVDVATADVTVDTAGTTVELSGDAAHGIAIEGPTGSDFEIGLPFANAADDGVVVDGAVVYDNNNGSTTTPLVHDDGSVQILTTISDASAPTTYEYRFDIAVGATLVASADGGAFILDAQGGVIESIDRPWATDANGIAVPTRFEIHGTSLVQVVDHRSAGVEYPVVADPTAKAGWWGILPVYRITFTSKETADINSKSGSPIAAASAALCGYMPSTTVKVVCGALYTAIRMDINQNAADAVKNKKCLAVRMPATGGLINLPAYDSSVTSC